MIGIGAKIDERSRKIAIFAKISKNPKKFGEILLRFLDSKGAKVPESCRSRKILQNEYLLAKFGADTAENEPSKV